MITRELVESMLDAFSRKDLPTVMAMFADDAVLVDPHYPNARMVGREAIEHGLRWGMGNMEKPGFTLRKLIINGDSAAVEVDAHHVFRGGKVLQFEETFIIETVFGKITRVQAYLPHGPSGLLSLVTALTRFIWWLQGKLHPPGKGLRPALPHAPGVGAMAYQGPNRRSGPSNPALGRRLGDHAA